MYENFIAMENILTVIYLEKRRVIQKNNKFPVKLRVTYQRKQIYIGLNISVTEEEFNKATTEQNPKGRYKDLKMMFAAAEQKAVNIIKEMPNFNLQSFKNRYMMKRANNGNVFDFYEITMANLEKEGRIKTSLAYKFSMTSLKKFCKSDILMFQSLTPEFLKDYENWMKENKASPSTVGIYLRCLRTIFNDAIESGNIKQEAYPFGKRKYAIPNSRNIKKALTKEEIKKIYDHDLMEGSEDQKWRDLWIFSYLCNGINIKDIAKLKFKDIGEESITFIRSKTESTTRKKLKPVVAALSDPVRTIINRWGNLTIKPENYVFTFLKNGMTPLEEYKSVYNANRTMNKYMKKIGKELGIIKDITSLTARHSFATILKKADAPLPFISEKLGHSSLPTTENYLDTFDLEKTKFWAEKLTDFL